MSETMVEYIARTCSTAEIYPDAMNNELFQSCEVAAKCIAIVRDYDEACRNNWWNDDEAIDVMGDRITEVAEELREGKWMPDA